MQTSEDRSTPILITVGVALLTVIVGGLVLLRRAGSPSSATPLPMSAEEKAYLTQISIADPRMTAAENFLGGTVTYLNARMTNNGSKTIRQLALKLEFHDTLEQVVLRDTTRPITLRSSPLKPGETRAFHAAFEHMPADWNQAPPAITPAYVGFSR